MVASKRRWQVRKTDILFLVGVLGFISQAVRAYTGGEADPVIVAGAIGLCGVPVVQRLDERCKHDPS